MLLPLYAQGDLKEIERLNEGYFFLPKDETDRQLFRSDGKLLPEHFVAWVTVCKKRILQDHGIAEGELTVFLGMTAWKREARELGGDPARLSFRFAG